MGRLALPFGLLTLVVAVAVVTDRPLPPADFTFINRGDVTTLDLQRMSWMQDFRVARLLFEGLVRQDVFTWDYRIEPAVAERWDVSADGRTYTFHLRAEARWSNGAPVRAGDFVYAWRRALLPDLGSDYVAQFQVVRGGRAFTAWREAQLRRFAASEVPDRAAAARELWERTLAVFDEMVGLRALDDRTLRVELERPTPYFLDLCAMPCFYPVYPPLVEQYESLDPRTGQRKFEAGWTRPPFLISNGPYVLTVWRFKRDMRLEINPHYWNPRALNFRSIAIPSVEDGNAAVLAFRSGAVDWVTDVTAPYRPELVALKQRFYDEHRPQYEALVAQGLDPVEIDRRLPPDPRKNVHVFPAFGTYFYNFNCLPRLRDGRANPFADARVRRAFAMAIDKRAICETVRRTGERPAGSLVPPDALAGYTPPRGLPYDPGRARRLLAEAGWPDPARFITVEILFNKDGGHDKIAEAVGRMWETHLGVSVRLVQRDIKVFRENLKNGDYIVSRAGWFADYGDPLTFLELSRTGDGNNDRKYSNPAFDALLDRAADEPDPERRLEILAEAERLLMEEELPMVPLFHYTQVYLFDPHRLSGISPHPRQEQQVHRMDIIGDGLGAEQYVSMPARRAGPASGGESRGP